jgi:hypothetical protein
VTGPDPLDPRLRAELQTLERSAPSDIPRLLGKSSEARRRARWLPTAVTLMAGAALGIAGSQLLLNWAAIGERPGLIAIVTPQPSPSAATAECRPPTIPDPAIDELGPQAQIRNSEPLHIRNGRATLWVSVEPDTDAQQLLVTGFTVNGRISGSTNGQLDRAAADQIPSDLRLSGTVFAGPIKFWQSGCWQLRVFAKGALIGSAVVKAEAQPAPPVGRFRTVAAIPDGPCVALELEKMPDPAQPAPAWWWDQGRSGDCSTRTSDLIRATATLVEDESGYQIELERGLMNGNAEVIRLHLVPVGDELQGSVTSAGHAPVRFVRVEEVAPSFAPLP